jgi:uncharacterized protein involved in exopolysaccharide biosynthesis
MFLRDLIVYARIVRRRWRLIVVLFVVTVVTTTLLSLRAKPFYRAWVKLQVGAAPPTDVSLYQSFRYDELQNQVAYTRAAFTELLSDRGLAWRTLSKVETTVGAEDLLAQTTVEAESGSNFVSVGVSAGTPEEAQVLANTLVEEALSYYGSLQAQSATAAREFISRELEAGREELSDAERALMQFKIENKIGSLDDDIRQRQNLVLSLLIARDTALAEGDLEKAANYDHIIAERQKELQELVGLSSEYESLVTTVNLTRGTYNLLLSKETEARIKENEILSVGFIQIVSPAQLPTKAISSFDPKIIVLSGVVSLIIGVILAFVWEYVETQLGAARQALPTQAATNGEPS